MKNKLILTGLFLLFCAATHLGNFIGIALAQGDFSRSHQRWMMAKFYAPLFHINIEEDPATLEWIMKPVRIRKAQMEKLFNEIKEDTAFVRFLNKKETEILEAGDEKQAGIEIHDLVEEAARETGVEN